MLLFASNSMADSMGFSHCYVCHFSLVWSLVCRPCQTYVSIWISKNISRAADGTCFSIKVLRGHQDLPDFQPNGLRNFKPTWFHFYDPMMCRSELRPKTFYSTKKCQVKSRTTRRSYSMTQASPTSPSCPSSPNKAEINPGILSVSAFFENVQTETQKST